MDSLYCFVHICLILILKSINIVGNTNDCECTGTIKMINSVRNVLRSDMFELRLQNEMLTSRIGTLEQMLQEKTAPSMPSAHSDRSRIQDVENTISKMDSDIEQAIEASNTAIRLSNVIAKTVQSEKKKRLKIESVVKYHLKKQNESLEDFTIRVNAAFKEHVKTKTENLNSFEQYVSDAVTDVKKDTKTTLKRRLNKLNKNLTYFTNRMDATLAGHMSAIGGYLKDFEQHASDTITDIKNESKAAITNVRTLISDMIETNITDVQNELENIGRDVSRLTIDISSVIDIALFDQKVVCDHNCTNGGMCFKDNTCRCRQWRAGKQCEKFVCDSSCSRNCGECIGPGICKCPEGRYGPNCEHALAESTTEHANTKTQTAINETITTETTIKQTTKEVFDVCSLRLDLQTPCSRGGSGPYWYYEQLSGKCKEVPYGECNNNQNNFRSRSECEAYCSRDRVCRPLAYEFSWRCIAYFEHWTYNADISACEMFVYGGCGGSANNFESKEACDRKCLVPNCAPKPTPPGEICAMEEDSGNCTANFRNWRYDSLTGRCVQFTYSGCRGNANNFQSQGECEAFCTKRVVCQKHEDPVVVCLAQFRRWRYEPSTGVCEKFIYGGCGGNANNFETLEACEEKCLEREPERPADVKGSYFEGSPSTILEYDSLPVSLRMRYVLTMEFRTQKPNGVMFYYSNSSHIEHISVIMKEGRIRYTFNLATGTAETKSTGVYNDGHWHKLELVRYMRDGYMNVDDELSPHVKSPGKAWAVNGRRPYYFCGIDKTNLTNMA